MKLFFPQLENGMGLTHGGYSNSFALSCLSVLREHDVKLCRLSDPSPTFTGNHAAEVFLNHTDCERMVIIDTDLIFKPEQLGYLLSHSEPFVAGIYPQGKPGLHFALKVMDEEIGLSCFAKNPFDKNINPLVEVKRVARGFSNIHRSVFEEMISKGAVKKYLDDASKKEQWEFWKYLPGGHSEDFRLCDDYRSIGGHIYVDQRCVCQHEKTAIYPIKGTYPE